MKISCVIPVYNEAERVGGVLSVVVGHPLVDEVIVVNDGSTDGSLAVLERQRGIQLISYERNRGKSYAVATGIQQARNDIVMLLDSDLIGLRPDDITALADPVLSSSADISMGMRGNAYRICKMIGLEYISGERVLPKALLADHLEEIGNLPSYSIEVFTNRLIIGKKCRIRVVYLATVENVSKLGKIGLWKSFWKQTGMVLQILKVVSLWEIIRQNYLMRSLIVHPSQSRYGKVF